MRAEPSLQGRHGVVGWLVERGLLGDAQARARVLALWEPGATVHPVGEAGDAWFVALPQPREARDPWPATPVVADGSPTLRRTVGGAPVEGLGPAVSPAAWLRLELADWPVHPLDDVEAPEIDLPGPPDREAFGIGAAPPEALDALGGPLEGVTAQDLVDGRHPAAARHPPAWVRALTAVDRWLRPGAGPGSPRATGLPAPASPLWERVLAWWDWTFLGATVRRHDGYLRELLERLDAEDPLEALRWAIPIGGDAAEGSAWQPTRGGLGPRDALRPQAPGPARSTLYGSDDALSALRQRYLRTARRLVDDGRIDEAAFVHADLLGDGLTAVQLCEEHGRHALGAQLAEWHLPDAGRAIALWARAGRFGDALRLAQQSGAFGTALAHLEALDAPDALVQDLRRAWALSLVASGQPLEAVELVAEDPELHDLAGPWLAPFLAGDHPEGGRARVLALRLSGRLQDAQAVVDGLDRADEGGRLDLLRRCAALPSTPLHDRVARAVLRRVWPGLGDRARLPHRHGGAWTDLVADLATPRPGAAAEPTPEVLEVGATRVHDAVVTPARFVVTTGERGTHVFLPDGRLHTQDPAAMDALVAGPGEVLVGVQTDADGLARLFRMEPGRSGWRPWGRVRLGAPLWGDPAAHWAPSHDGRGWWVLLEDRLVHLDLRHGTLQALRVLRPESAAVLEAWGPEGVSVWSSAEDERWVYRAPRWRLTLREPAEGPRRRVGHVPVPSPLVCGGRSLTLGGDGALHRPVHEPRWTRCRVLGLAGEVVVADVGVDREQVVVVRVG